MKKLLTVLLVASVLLSGLYAGTTWQDGETDWETKTCCDREDYMLNDNLNFTLNSFVGAEPYTMELKYDDEYMFDGQALGCFDITNCGCTKCFKAYLSDGNCCVDLTANVTVTCGNFQNMDATSKSVTDVATTIELDEEVTSKAIYTSPHTFAHNIPAGPNDDMLIAGFRICWAGNENLPAGRYQATGCINVEII